MKKTLLSLSFFLFCPLLASAEPAFGGSSANRLLEIINPGDASVPFDLVFEGAFKIEGIPKDSMFVFTATYADGIPVEFQVDPELGDESTTREEASFHGHIIGQLPYGLRFGLRRVRIFAGSGRVAGGQGGITIYTESLKAYDDLMEEILIHELGHASLDPIFRDSDEWRQAQAADGEFISAYGRDNPEREDFTESFQAYFALRGRPERISESTANLITDTIPARIQFFDDRNFNMEPFVEFDFQMNAGLSGSWFEPATSGQGFFLEVLPEQKRVFLGWYTFESVYLNPQVTAYFGDIDHRWITALGPYEGNTAILTAYKTSGGLFDEETPVPVTEEYDELKVSLEFSSCTEGVVRYDFTPSLKLGFAIPIRRIAHDNVALCETLASMSD